MCNGDPIIPHYMMCHNDYGSLVAFDVNIVQPFFPNKTQGVGDYSMKTLNKLYQDGYRLDWKSVQGIIPDSIFVGDKYWRIFKQ